MNCVTNLIMRWPSLVPGRRDQVSKPHLTSWWEETILRGTHRENLRSESNIQSLRSPLPNAFWSGIRIHCLFLLCPFTALSFLPMWSSKVKEKGWVLLSGRSRLWPHHLSSLSFYLSKRGKTSFAARIFGNRQWGVQKNQAQNRTRSVVVAFSCLSSFFLNWLRALRAGKLPQFLIPILSQEARRPRSVQIIK